MTGRQIETEIKTERETANSDRERTRDSDIGREMLFFFSPEQAKNRKGNKSWKIAL